MYRSSGFITSEMVDEFKDNILLVLVVNTVKPDARTTYTYTGHPKIIGGTRLLLITSLVGSIIGFLVFPQAVMKTKHQNHAVRMRICMLNSMSLAFIFAMLVEFTTDSKILAIIIPVAAVGFTLVTLLKSLTMLDLIESGIATLMSTTMSAMLVGMISPIVIWVIQCVLVLIELMLFIAAKMPIPR